MQSFFGLNFGGGGEIDIILDEADTRKVLKIVFEYEILIAQWPILEVVALVSILPKMLIFSPKP